MAFPAKGDHYSFQKLHRHTAYWQGLLGLSLDSTSADQTKFPGLLVEDMVIFYKKHTYPKAGPSTHGLPWVWLQHSQRRAWHPTLNGEDTCTSRPDAEGRLCKREQESKQQEAANAPFSSEILLLTMCTGREHHQDYTSGCNLNISEVICLNIILKSNSGERKWPISQSTNYAPMPCLLIN